MCGGGGGAWAGGGGGAWLGGLTGAALGVGGGGTEGGGTEGRAASAGRGRGVAFRLDSDCPSSEFMLRTVPNLPAGGLWGEGDRGARMLCALLIFRLNLEGGAGFPFKMGGLGAKWGFPWLRGASWALRLALLLDFRGSLSAWSDDWLGCAPFRRPSSAGI